MNNKERYKMNYIFKEIKKERYRQNELWGEQNHSSIEWLGILGEEYGEVCKAATDMHFKKIYKDVDCPDELQEYREELVQVAAVAVQMIECLDRNGK
jgi:hypothetical protein